MLAVFLVYLLAHFAIYVLLRRALRSEKRIFLYHFVPASVLAAVALVLLAARPEQFDLPALVLVLSVHGIYSLSFLELWSLAQGGYSLSILAGIQRAAEAGVQPDFSALARIGAAKQQDRIRGVEKLGLIRGGGPEIVLTSRGRAVAACLGALLRWVGAAPAER